MSGEGFILAVVLLAVFFGGWIAGAAVTVRGLRGDLEDLEAQALALDAERLALEADRKARARERERIAGAVARASVVRGLELLGTAKGWRS